MRIVVPYELNQDTFERMVQDISNVESEIVDIDMRDLQFIEPYGLVGLVSVVRLLHEQGINIRITPARWGVRSYLKRMGVYPVLEEYAPGVTPTDIFGTSRARPLLEVTKVDLSRGIDQFMGIGSLLYERMRIMLADDQRYPSTVVNDLITSIIEVCQNIEHSSTFGYVAAQKYPGWRGAVKVAVMDVGVGISASLQPRYKSRGQKWSDRKALSYAISPNYTARPTGSGGLGLVTVIDFIKEHRGSDFSLRSGTAKYIVSESGEEQFVGGLDFFPGTQVSMTIRPAG